MSIRVGIGRCKINCIKSLSELILKGKCIIALVFVLSFDVTFFIVNFVAVSHPTYSILIIFLGKSKRLEPIAKQRLFFNQIYYIKFDSLILFGVSDFEIEPLIVSTSIDVILQNEVIGLKNVTWVIIIVSIEQIATLEMRVKDETTVVVFRLSLCSFGFDLRKIAITFWFKVNSCNIHENISKVVLLGGGIKAMVVHISVLINIPKSASEFFLTFGVELFYLFLHFSMLEECILDGDEPTTDIFASFFSFRQDVAVGPCQLLSIEAASRVDFVGLVLPI